MYTRSPRQDELNPAKLELLCAAVRQEIEAETIQYLTSEQEIEYLAQAVESGRKNFVDKVGLYTSDGAKALAQKIPQGSRLMVSISQALLVGRFLGWCVAWSLDNPFA